MAQNIIVAVAGVLLVWAVLRDVFKSAIVPREVALSGRISELVTRFLWAIWRRRALAVLDGGRRENLLSTYAPFQMVALLLVWVASLTVGYGLVLYALRGELRPQPESLGSAIYFAGASLLTIGFGDVVGVTPLARFVSLAAGASGLGVVAVVTAYLFAVFGAYQRREAFIVQIGARAGVPPSGTGLLAIAAHAGVREGLPGIFRRGQQWTAEIMESQLAYPILSYFRSNHDDESWVGTLGTLLDAAVLLIAAVDDNSHGEARIMYNIGRHATADLSHHYRLPIAKSVGVEREEFDRACERLTVAGYALHPAERAWETFQDLRGAYAGQLNAMARFLEIPPLQWIGDRTLLMTAVARARGGHN